jgi:hypothetical protein
MTIVKNLSAETFVVVLQYAAETMDKSERRVWMVFSSGTEDRLSGLGALVCSKPQG